MAIYLEDDVLKAIQQHAVDTYPDECCGFMFGMVDASDRRHVRVHLPVENIRSENRSRRFEISPREYMAAEAYAEEHGWSLVGIYHSHPDHPAVASETDRQYAQPFFSYIIQSVRGGQPERMRSWRLREDHQFEEEPILEYAPDNL